MLDTDTSMNVPVLAGCHEDETVHEFNRKNRVEVLGSIMLFEALMKYESTEKPPKFSRFF